MGNEETELKGLTCWNRGDEIENAGVRIRG